MDIATVIGGGAAMLLLATAIIVGGGNLLGFIDTAAGLIIGGGIFCGVLVAFPMHEFMRLFAVIKNVFLPPKFVIMDIINQLVSLAEVARREGILSLDSRVAEIEDPFMASGVQMMVDGMKPEAIEAILESDIEALHERHNVGAGMVSQLGKAAPVFGLVATLIGLVLMLAHLDPDTIGEHMAVALTGTLYGLVTANVFFLPWTSKLKYYDKLERTSKELIITGLLEIQKGESPRMVKLRLLTYLPENKRPKDDDTA
ncbi:chemotaxis protein MotA [Planctomycetales bacterium]|nr:chemotaxis protein MotA [Planctomycetales bacterium]